MVVNAQDEFLAFNSCFLGRCVHEKAFLKAPLINQGVENELYR